MKALKESGINSENIIIKSGDLSPISGYNNMKEVLFEGRSISAVFAANDQMAVGAIKAIKEAGLKIPENISIIGFDNVFIASTIEPSLSTINVPKYKMGIEAVEMLLRHINDPEIEPEKTELPINLIVRQSTDLRGDKNWDLFGW